MLVKRELHSDDYIYILINLDKDEASIIDKLDYGDELEANELPIVKSGARVCDIKNKLMDSGFVWGDGTFYSSGREITLKELREEIKEGAYDFEEVGVIELLSKTDKQLLDYAYSYDILYYTEWELSEEDSFHIEYQGKFYEVTY